MLGLLLVGTMGLSNCVASSAPTGPFANVRGTWSYAGQQTAPVRSISGTLVVSAQSGDLITGMVSLEQSDGLGGITTLAGPLSGRVIELTDADFDVAVAGTDRRHVARISANHDTLVGVWAQVGGGVSGTFRATRVP